VQTTTLGPLTVTRLALGAMLMGGKTSPDEAERILDRYRASGGNFIDTADVYEDGGSERVLAPWLAHHRSEVVVATKVRFEVSDLGGAGLAPDRIHAACDASLRRLGTDVIDLYQLHAPDPAVPVEESLEALEALVRAGKVRALTTGVLRGPTARTCCRESQRGRCRGSRRHPPSPKADGEVPCGHPRAEIAVPLPAAGPPFEQSATTPRALSALLCRIGPGGPTPDHHASRGHHPRAVVGIDAERDRRAAAVWKMPMQPRPSSEP
jgi:hypothetical protein